MSLRHGLVLLLASATGAGAQDLPRYVGSGDCTACHEAEAEAWTGSHHDLAWTLPEDGAVIADFDGTEFTSGGMSVRFHHEGGAAYSADVTESDGESTQYPLHSVIGIAPLQQYLFETEPGRLQSFDIVWDADEARWYDLYPDQALPPDDGLHWTGPYKNWNSRCAECHATGYEKNYDTEKRVYNSTQAEIGVGCEACHGPGSAHLEWTVSRAPVEAPGLDPYGFSMATDAGGEAWTQQCATCHSRREAFGDGNPLPGTTYDDAYGLTLLEPRLYHADGQIEAEVYVYGSFLQSKMYEKGVTCTNCHDPHRAALKAEGNAVCTQCHSEAGNPEFPSLPLKVFDGPSHHFHEEGSEGAQCKSCHMVEQTYMGIDERADHSFRIPRPDLSAETRAPDACTGCHEDKTAAWAAERIAEWYPDSDHRGPHFGTSFALAERDPAAAKPELTAIALDEAKPNIVRATALFLLERSIDATTASETEALLRDDSPMVRAGAVRLQRGAGDQNRVANTIGLLRDPSRQVRFTVAPEILSARIASLPESMATDMRNVMGEWQNSLAKNLDFPETNMVLAGTALLMRNFEAARTAFREAVVLDPQSVDAWAMIVRLTEAMDGPEAAKAELDKAMAVNPSTPALVDLMLQLEGN